MKNFIYLAIGISIVFVLNLNVFAATRTVTNNLDDGVGSLRYEITNANSGDNIVFDANYTIVLASTITIDKNLKIIGNGIANTIIDGDDSYSIFLINSASVDIQGLTLRNGSGASDGANIANNLGILSISNCSLSGNNTSNYGAIYNHSSSTITQISNCIFDNNQANMGSAIYNDNDGIIESISSSTFSENTCNINVGCIYNSGIISSITNSVFDNNNCGAITNTNQIGSILNTTFSNNTNPNNNDGIIKNFYFPMSPIIPTITTISNSTFDNNSSEGPSGGGGTILNSGYIGLITYCTLSNNSSTVFGGYSAGITNNTSGSNSGTITTISYSTFNNNNSNQNEGGGIRNDGYIGLITYCTLSNNTSVVGAGLGNFGQITMINNSTFNNNSADYGGGIYNYNTIVEIRNSTFFANIVSDDGGGINNSGEIHSLNNSTISQNRAYNGGGIYNNYSFFSAFNNIISSNYVTSGNGADFCASSSSSITDGGYNIVQYQYGTSSFNSIYDILWNGSAWVRNGIVLPNQNLNLATSLSNNGGFTQTLSIGTGSFAIGAGIYTATLDQRGLSRNNPPTIGAYEYAPLQIPILPTWGIALLILAFCISVSYGYKKMILQ